MLILSRVISEIVIDYIRSAEKSGREYRLIIPGITKRIAREIHQYLIDKNVNTYLIVGTDEPTDKEKRMLRPEAMTSRRIGSFVSIVDPGQLVTIQDSIRGVGGAIRSQAFSEEWPWIDDGNDTFKFDGPVLDKIIESWSPDNLGRKWLRDFIKNGLIKATKNYPFRAELVLEDILGGFESELYPTIDGLCNSFLFHIGLPFQNTVIPSAELFIKDSVELCQGIVNRCKGEEALRDYISKDMVAELITDTNRQAEVREALNVFFDGLGTSKTQEIDLLAFHSCWGNDPSHWHRLDSELLAALFEIGGKKKQSNISCVLSCDRGLVSPNSKKVATFYGEKILIYVNYKIHEALYGEGNWEVMLLLRNKKEYSKPIEAAAGEIEMEIDTADLIKGKYLSNIPLRIALGKGDNILADSRFSISLCGEQRPSFVLIESGFDVTNATLVDDETPEKRIELSEPSFVYLFSYYDDYIPLVYNDKNEPIDIDFVIQGIYKTSQRIDPTIEISGQAILICCFDEKSLKAIVSLEAKDIVKGEFTIEDELRVNLIESQSDSRILELIKLFSGEIKDPYPLLGKINDATRQKGILASKMTRADGWKPVLANIFKLQADEQGKIGNYINYLGNVDGQAFKDISLPDEAIELLRDYSEKRKTVIQNIEGNIIKNSKETQHPTYATHPIFVANKREEMEKAIDSYLNCYLELLCFLDSNYRNLSWPECFVLSYLDCVVHWEDNGLRNSILLIGPWHPVILAKRFMIQAALYERAKRFANDKTRGKEFRKLTALLNRIAGFHWFIGLSQSDVLFEPIYVVTTNDPGWHLAFKTRIENNFIKGEIVSLTVICEKLSKNLDLYPDVLLSGNESLAASSLSSYIRSFPSRRSIGINISNGYSKATIIDSIDRILHSEDGPTVEGNKLPGGVRLLFQDKVHYVDGIQWFEPSIAVYENQDNIQGIKNFMPDIYLLPLEHTLSFSREDDNLSLPRGNLLESVFSQPIQLITEGQAQLPISKSCEYQVLPEGKMYDSLGNTFVKAVAKLCSLNDDFMATMRAVKLPSQLDSPWVIVPGSELDPAILVKYVQDGVSRSIQERALWDYKICLSGQGNEYYILSTIPKSYSVVVNGAFGRDNIADGFINELGKIGIAIGGEALKSGRNALGVIGLVGAVRLFSAQASNSSTPLRCNKNLLGFLIPVDSFDSFFGSPDNQSVLGAKRADLLAIQLILPSNSDDLLTIYACGIESKYVSDTYTEGDSHNALAQASATTEEFIKLIEKSLGEGSIPERLGLLSLIKFGLRITRPTSQGDSRRWADNEIIIYNSILKKRYRYVDSKYKAILVTTEMGLIGAADYKILGDRLWVRINKDHWPGVSESSHIANIRRELSGLFFGENASEEDDNFNNEVIIENSSGQGDQENMVESKDEDLGSKTDKTDQDTRNSNENTYENQEDKTHNIEKPLGKIMIGADDGRRLVYYDPQSLVDPLDNLNIMVTGSSGTGKTQFIKYLICQMRQQGKNVLILDFKNDFASDMHFLQKANMSSKYVAFEGLPYNPLIPYPVRHPGTGELFIQCGHHIAGVVSVLRRTYGLGVQQQAAVKNAISDAYLLRGIPATGSNQYNESMSFPDFSNVGQKLHADNLQAYNRLDPLFTLGIFKEEHRGESFNTFVNCSLVLDLSQIQSDEIKNAIAQLLIMSAHAYYNSQPTYGGIRQLLVFDEAHRVLSSDYILKIVRECRAYGVGTLLSSQYPSDFPQEISASMAFKVIHSNGRDLDRVRDIVRVIGCEGKERLVSNLEMFQAILDSRHHPHTIIRTMNYPLYIVWDYLVDNKVAKKEELSRLSGLDTTKLSIENLIKQFERLGLADARGNEVFLITNS